MTESIEAAVLAGILEDIATLARRLAETEPYKSASGPEALAALATHLEVMGADDPVDDLRVVRVAVRKKRGG